MNLTKSRLWTKKEIKILKENYSSQPMSLVFEKLPNRTPASILHKARDLNLLSNFYYESRYTKEEDDYLKTNYIYKSNDELAKILNRSRAGIQLHLYSLGCFRNIKKVNKYEVLARYVRYRIKPWVDIKKEECNFTCYITGDQDNIVLHHIRSFNLLLEETILMLDFPLYTTITEYSDEQLELLTQTFLDIQENYNSYVCINKDIHINFHSIYGYGNNTEEQWNEYLNKRYQKIQAILK